MSTPDTRLVSMTLEQLDQAVAAVLSEGEFEDARLLQAAWDAAPADPADEVEMALFAYDFPQTRRPWTIQEREEYAARTALVMAALGCSPHPRNEDTDACQHEWRPSADGSVCAKCLESD